MKHTLSASPAVPKKRVIRRFRWNRTCGDDEGFTLNAHLSPHPSARQYSCPEAISVRSPLADEASHASKQPLSANPWFR